jgi:hypothetical protein
VLEAQINPNYQETPYEFEYATMWSRGEISLPGGRDQLGGTAFGPNLQAGTTYYYRAVASNVDGVSYGAVKAVTTASFPALPAFKSSPQVVAPEASPPTPIEVPGTTTTKTKTLTNAQKLAKALKACAKKLRGKRAACEKARKKHPKKRKGDRNRRCSKRRSTRTTRKRHTSLNPSPSRAGKEISLPGGRNQLGWYDPRGPS